MEILKSEKWPVFNLQFLRESMKKRVSGTGICMLRVGYIPIHMEGETLREISLCGSGERYFAFLFSLRSHLDD